MIQEVKMFTIVCDCCKKDAFSKDEYSAWNCKEWAEDMAMESNWIYGI